MLLNRRITGVEATHYIYPSQVEYLLKKLNGAYDTKSETIYFVGKAGKVIALPYSYWLLESDSGFEVMSEQQLFQEFSPNDWEEAYRVLGSRRWPGDPANVYVSDDHWFKQSTLTAS